MVWKYISVLNTSVMMFWICYGKGKNQMVQQNPLTILNQELTNVYINTIKFI